MSVEPASLARAMRVLTRIEAKTLRDIRWLIDASHASGSPDVTAGLPDVMPRRPQFSTREQVERLFLETRMPKARIRKSMQPLLNTLTENGVLVPTGRGRDWLFYIDEATFQRVYPDGFR